MSATSKNISKSFISTVHNNYKYTNAITKSPEIIYCARKSEKKLPDGNKRLQTHQSTCIFITTTYGTTTCKSHYGNTV